MKNSNRKKKRNKETSVKTLEGNTEKREGGGVRTGRKE